MLKIFDLEKISIEDILPRDEQKTDFETDKTVADIIADVRKNGDDAVKKYTQKFDGVLLDDFSVDASEIAEAFEDTDKAFASALLTAKENIVAFHKKQLTNGFEIESDGVKLGQRVIPLERVGLYVPGGTASYPSTVLMNAIPAKIAGVKDIIMITPPDKHGKVNKNILAAAYVANISKIYKIGGAQGIAALAYGTQTIPKVDKIVGPGNIFVATAKKQVFGTVDIDMIAGPSEILVVADDTAKPDYVAADLLSQAEHDKRATAVLVTTSKVIAEQVAECLEKRLSKLSRKDIAEEAINSNGKIIIAKDIEEALKVSNALAPEHLELCVADPFKYLDKVTNAGSVFLGNYTPEAVGDYIAGSNHTLPTSGTARFFSPLSVDAFVKRSQYVCYTDEALKKIGNDVVLFAEKEGLTAHGLSVSARLEQSEGK